MRDALRQRVSSAMRLISTMVVVLVVQTAAAGVAAAAPPDPNLLSAQAEAARLVALAPLPTGTSVMTTDPYTGLAFTAPGPREPWQVLFAGHWLAPTPVTQTGNYIASHLPDGSKVISFGYTGGLLGFGETLAFPTVPARGITGAQLELDLSPYGRTQTEIDATATVLWRPSYELIPAATRTLAVSVDDGLRLTVSGTNKIAPFARLFSQLATFPADQPSCPGGSDPQNGVVKLLSASGTSLGTLTITDLGVCNYVSADIGGRRGTQLWDHGLLDLLWREGAVNACHAAQFTPTIKPATRYRRTMSVNIELVHSSSTECSIDGYPRLAFRTPAGKVLRIRLRHKPQATPALATTERGDKLVITASWAYSRTPCPSHEVGSLTIRIPGLQGQVQLPLTTPLNVCRGPLNVSAAFNPGFFADIY